MSESQETIYKVHREASDKYTYFLLAASGAAIGFAATQTQTATISWAKLPLGFAVFCWAVSFYCGCRQVQQVINITLQNFEYLRVKAGEHPQFRNDAVTIRTIKDHLENLTSGKWGRNWGTRQLRWLIFGAVLYIVWHITEMAIRTLNVVAR